MDILKILKAYNLEGEQAEAIEAAIKKDIHTGFIPKAQYNKKVQELDSIKTDSDDLRARLEAPNEYESKYNDILKEFDSLKGEYEGYKSEVEFNTKKSSINGQVTKLLKENGYTNDKVCELLLKNLDYNNIEVGEEGLTGFDLGTFTKGYESLKTVSNIEGTFMPTPPETETTNIDPWLDGYK